MKTVSRTMKRLTLRALGLLAVVLSLAEVNAQCLAPPSGIVSWWDGDAAGTIAFDIQGSHDGALMNGASIVPGYVGTAFSLDGIDDFVEVPDSNSWNFGSGDFTIELWVNLASVRPSDLHHPAAVFIGNDEGGGIQDKWFFALGEGLLNWHRVIAPDDPGNIFLVQAPFSPVIDRWHHLAVRKGGDTYTIYADGFPIGSEAHPDPVPNASAPLTIGQAEGIGFVHGLIDEVGMYDRALSHAEIHSIFNAGTAGKCKAPVLTCMGFDPPMAGGAVTVKKNRVLPLKAQLLDSDGFPIDGLEIVSHPVVVVVFDSGVGPAVDVSDQALSAGQGSDGNEFVFTEEGIWQFNLKTSNYTAAGTYTISMVSGDELEYGVSACVAQFVIE